MTQVANQSRTRTATTWRRRGTRTHRLTKYGAGGLLGRADPNGPKLGLHLECTEPGSCSYGQGHQGAGRIDPGRVGTLLP